MLVGLHKAARRAARFHIMPTEELTGARTLIRFISETKFQIINNGQASKKRGGSAVDASGLDLSPSLEQSFSGRVGASLILFASRVRDGNLTED
jgi:hypothetical protein